MTGEQFQQYREEMGLTRREMAQLLGYNHSDPDQDYHTIRRYEAGHRTISPICARLVILIHRQWQSTGAVPEFSNGCN